jgi:hypothetical protein
MENIEIDVLLEDIQEVTFDYEQYAMDMRNPMTPLVGPHSGWGRGPEERRGEARPPEIDMIVKHIDLSGIMWDAKSPLAVVDNEVVAPGDELPKTQGIVVDAINVDHIVVRVNDTPIEIELKEH